MSRILSFPAYLRQKSNPYLDILGTALGEHGVRFDDYRPLHPFQRADALHLHWPDRLYYAGALGRHPLISGYAFATMARTADRIRKAGGRFVWTAHNIKPHEPPPPRHAGVWDRWHDRLLGRVDTVICMTETAREAVREGVPAVRDARFVVARHPHYRSIYTQWAPREQTRAELAIPEGGTLTAMIGFVRRYKGIAEAIALFRQLDPGHVLLVAGACADPALRAELEAAAADAPNIRLVLRSISDDELASWYKASDLALFNFVDILNSGSLLTALSLDVPCLAPRRGAMIEVQQDVGDWCRLFDAPLDIETLRAALERPRPAGRPDLSLYEPAAVARAHLAAYGLERHIPSS